jgi:hypothetical protein
MKRSAIILAAVAVLGLAVGGGYWLGFRHAWSLGLMAEAPVRGSLAIGNLRLLELGRASDLRSFYESEVDSGLMWWARLEDDPNYRFLNVLSGHNVVPEYERYVKRIAIYRKAHKSPLRERALVESMLKSAREADPAFARELEEGGHEADRAIDSMVNKYGQ